MRELLLNAGQLIFCSLTFAIRYPLCWNMDPRNREVRMPVMNEILRGKIRSFKGDFVDTAKNIYTKPNGKRIHNGEYGSHREHLTRGFLRSFVPHRLSISHGFVVNIEDDLTTQADVVIFDATQSPLVETENRQAFFAAEAVCGIGEVKSLLSLSDLKGALRKLAKQKAVKSKALRGKGESGSIYAKEHQLITFLVCERITCSHVDQINAAILEAYSHKDVVDPPGRHNLILSLEDGLGIYCLAGAEREAMRMVQAYPDNMQANEFLWIKPRSKNGLDHIALFCSLVFQLTRDAKLSQVPMMDYIGQLDLEYCPGPQLVSSGHEITAKNPPRAKGLEYVLPKGI